LDTLEKGIILLGTGRAGGLFVGVMLQHLAAVRLLDLFVGGPPTVFGESKDGVVVLVLEGRAVNIHC
jgi:hypothetical protein